MQPTRRARGAHDHSGHRHRHLEREGRAAGRRRPRDRAQQPAAARQPAAHRPQRAVARSLVAGHLPRPRRAEGTAPSRTGRDHRDRPVRPDARRHAARRRRRGAAALHPVERRPQRGRMCRAGARLAGAAPGHRQHRHAWLHGAQAAVGAQARATDLRAHGQGAAAQGLPALAPGRRVRGRHVRRLGHAVAGRRRAPLVRGRAVGLRHAHRSDAAPRGGQRARRSAAPRARVALGLSPRADPRRRRRRQRRRCGGRRRGAPWRRLRVAGHLGCAVGHHGALRPQPGARRARLLPCRAEHLAPDGRAAVGGILPGLVGRGGRAHRNRAAGRTRQQRRRREPGVVRTLPVGRTHTAQRRPRARRLPRPGRRHDAGGRRWRKIIGLDTHGAVAGSWRCGSDTDYSRPRLRYRSRMPGPLPIQRSCQP